MNDGGTTKGMYRDSVEDKMSKLTMIKKGATAEDMQVINEIEDLLKQIETAYDKGVRWIKIKKMILKRTDTVLSILLLKDVDVPSYMQAIQQGMPAGNIAIASTLAAADSKPVYSMRNLNSPMSATSMVIPESMKDFLSGHAKVTTDYTQDWPQAAEDNPFGEHHPFGFKSNSNP